MPLLDGHNQPLCPTCLLAKQCCVITGVDPSEHALTERAAKLVEGTTVNKETAGIRGIRACREYVALTRSPVAARHAPKQTRRRTDTFWFYDGNQAVLQFDGATAADLSHRYLWGPVVDQLLADETVDDGGAEDVLWTLTDWQGSVRHLASYDDSTDATTIENHKFYDAYGNVYDETDDTVDTLFGYTGRMWDDDIDLQWNLARWYDPEVCRWLTEDPADFGAGDPNLYRYVGNSPGLAVDPSGLDSMIIAGASGQSVSVGCLGIPDGCTYWVGGTVCSISARNCRSGSEMYRRQRKAELSPTVAEEWLPFERGIRRRWCIIRMVHAVSPTMTRLWPRSKKCRNREMRCLSLHKPWPLF